MMNATRWALHARCDTDFGRAVSKLCVLLWHRALLDDKNFMHPGTCRYLRKISFLQLYFDGRFFCEYKHRAPVEMVTHLVMDGDVSLQQSDRSAAGDEMLVDTLTRSLAQLLCLPASGYNLVRSTSQHRSLTEEPCDTLN